MKDRIRQILREETSGLNPKVISGAYKMMNNLTKDCLWYFDTPEERFELSPESIWLINPETKEWVLELEKDESLWYYNNIYSSFKKYFNMVRSDFESFIKLWVEDALKIGVSTTLDRTWDLPGAVEDALKRGVSTTGVLHLHQRFQVEDALKRGVSTTHSAEGLWRQRVDDALKRGKELR